MSRFTACLWSDDQAEEAAKSYTAIFKNSRIKAISHYGDSAAAATIALNDTAWTCDLRRCA